MRVLVIVAIASCGSRDADPPSERRPAPGYVPVTQPAPPRPPAFEVAPPTDAIVSLGRGERHACVVRASGAVDCWGQHEPCTDRCELPPPPDARVRRVPGVDDAIAISENARCVIRKPGTVACLAPDRLELVAVAELAQVRAIDPAARCFVVGTGGVRCLDNERHVVTVANVRDAIAVVSADSLACAIRKSGDLVCGEHADMTAAWRPLLGIAKVDSLAMAGESEPRACTVLAGAVQCFSIAGSFEAGPLRVIEREDRPELRGASHLAFGTDLPPGYERGRQILEAVVAGKIIRFAPDDREDIPVLADAVKHVAGCAVRAGGSVVCWGRNEGGVLAQPTTLGTAHVPPTRVPGIRDVVDLALATTKTYALTGDGQLYAWGSLVRFGATSRPERVKLGLGPAMLVQIGATPDGLGCMRSAAGEVWCQVDPMAQLGRPRLEQLDTEAVQSIAVSDKVVLALRADGVLETHALQVLEGVAMLAVAAPADADIVEVASRYDRVCTRTRAGAVRCPSVIAGIDAASAIAVGDDFACALQRGTVACWHYDADRKLSPATQVATIRDATDLAAATDYACAVHGAGRVACWHFTRDGSAQTPVEVLAAGAVDVELGYGTADQLYRSRHQLHGPSAGGEYGCAIMTDRTVTCWGMHLFGELGDGSLVESTSPIGVVL